MRVLITGAEGFIAKNLRSHLALDSRIEILDFTRQSSITHITECILQSDFIYHLAGANRPSDEDEFTTSNTGLTEFIIETLKSQSKQTPLLLASSTQAESDNPYGRSKLAAEQVVADWALQTGAPAYIYRLPGVFGKWSRPNYNSVVSTFCHNLTHELPLNVSDPENKLRLVYVDDVVSEFSSLLEGTSAPFESELGLYRVIPQTFTLSLGELRERLESLYEIRKSLVVPDLGDRLNKYLYATLLSYLDITDFGYKLDQSIDTRGWLAEFVKSKSFGQVFVSKTKPGISRGNHWHKTKVEKFLVVSGYAEITFRNKIDSQDIIRYQVNGDDALVLDIPVGYVHAITNIGDSDLLTIFWASEILDKNHPDTYYEIVAEQH